MINVGDTPLTDNSYCNGVKVVEFHNNYFAAVIRKTEQKHDQHVIFLRLHFHTFVKREHRQIRLS